MGNCRCLLKRFIIWNVELMHEKKNSFNEWFFSLSRSLGSFPWFVILYMNFQVQFKRFVFFNFQSHCNKWAKRSFWCFQFLLYTSSHCLFLSLSFYHCSSAILLSCTPVHFVLNTFSSIHFETMEHLFVIFFYLLFIKNLKKWKRTKKRLLL